MTHKGMDQEGWQRLKAAMGRRLIEDYRLLYAKHENPTHALDAYRIARVVEIEVPGWVLELFDQWAEVLCANRPNSAKAIADALGLGTKGGPSIPSQASTQVRNLRIVDRVLELRERAPKGRTLEVFLDVAEEFDLSADRVQGVWYDLTGDDS